MYYQNPNNYNRHLHCNSGIQPIMPIMQQPVDLPVTTPTYPSAALPITTPTSGCCVRYGYGSRMEPCCFKYQDGVSSCSNPSGFVGGGSKFYPGQTCDQVQKNNPNNINLSSCPPNFY